MTETNLQTRDVLFNGAQLKTVQNELDGKIYAGVKWICNGIGLTEDQGRAQGKKVQTDLVLKKGCVKFDTGVFDPYNETIALDIDYLPLWLAKISITPSMKRNNPELTENLITYQLKAKDVLASAFLPKEKYNPQQIDSIQTQLNTLTNLVSSVIKLQQTEQKPRSSRYSNFKSRMFSKFDDLSKALNMDRRSVMSQLFKEHSSTYRIDYDDYRDECITKTGVENPYTLDIIDSNKELRQTFEDTVDNMFDSYGLSFNAPQEYNAFAAISEDDDELPF